MQAYRHIARTRGGDADDVTRGAVLLDPDSAMVGHRLIPRQAVSYVAAHEEQQMSWLVFPALVAALHAALALTGLTRLAPPPGPDAFYWTALWTAPTLRVIAKNYFAFSCAIMTAYTIISFFDEPRARGGDASDVYFKVLAKVFVLMIGAFGLFLAAVFRIDGGAVVLTLATPFSPFGLTEMGLAVLLAAGPSFAVRRLARGGGGWAYCSIVPHGGAITRIGSKNASFMTEATRVIAQWAAGALEGSMLIDLNQHTVQGKPGDGPPARPARPVPSPAERALSHDRHDRHDHDDEREPFSEPALSAQRPLASVAPPERRGGRSGDPPPPAAAPMGAPYGGRRREDNVLNGHGRDHDVPPPPREPRRDERPAASPANGSQRLALATQKRVLGDIHMLREVAARDLRRDPRRLEAVDMALARLETLVSPRDGVVDAHKAQALLSAVRDWLGPASDATPIVASIARTVLR